MPTLFYKGPDCAQIKKGLMITVAPGMGHPNQVQRDDIEKALKRIGFEPGEIKVASAENFWETEKEHFQRISAPTTEQSSIPQSNNGAGGGSGFWGFAAGAAAGAAKAVGGGLKAGGNFVVDRIDQAKKERLEEEYRDMQAKREYSEKHGQEIADKIKELQEKIKIIEKDSSLTACARLQGQLDCLAEEYLLEQSITMGDSNLQTLRDKYRTLINNTIKKFEIPKEEPELTEVLQYLAENARKTDKFTATDKENEDNENKVENWISGAMYKRLDFLKGLYSKHPVMKLYNAKLVKQKAIIISVGIGIAVLIVLYFMFLA